MVANAGIIVAKKILEVSVEEWDKVQSVSIELIKSFSSTDSEQVNVRGIFLCYREAGEYYIYME